MSKHQKTRDKMGRVPTPSDVRWDDLVGLLNSLGLDELPGDGSRRKFVHRDTKAVMDIHRPHPQPTLKQYQVRNVLGFLDKHGL